MITTEIKFSESLFRRLQATLDRYPNLSVSALCAEAIGCYLRLLDTAEELSWIRKLCFDGIPSG
jgi:hypothetical protein